MEGWGKCPWYAFSLGGKCPTSFLFWVTNGKCASLPIIWEADVLSCHFSWDGKCPGAFIRTPPKLVGRECNLNFHRFSKMHFYSFFFLGSGSVPEFFHTMRRQFTEDEWRSIRHSGDETEQLKTFYRLWVCGKYESD